MVLNFTDANIVLLSSVQHIVGLISAQWLKDNNLIKEQSIQTFNMPGVSIFNSESYRILANDERIQVATVKEGGKYLSVISKVIKEYVRASGSLPFKAIGFNFNFNLRENKDEVLPTIAIKMENINSIEEFLPDFDINLGTIINAKKEDYILEIRIHPKKSNLIKIGCNYQINVDGIDHDKIYTNLEKINEYYKFINSFIQRYGG